MGLFLFDLGVMWIFGMGFARLWSEIDTLFFYNLKGYSMTSNQEKSRNTMQSWLIADFKALQKSGYITTEEVDEAVSQLNELTYPELCEMYSVFKNA